jgi:tetratricopeptide (TPR) repeat protein
VEGDLDAAIATHSQAIELAPDNEIAHYNLSLAYHRLPDLTQAIVHGEKASELQPSNPHKWVALAMAYWDHGERDRALNSYQTAVNLDSRYRDPAYLDHLQEAGFSAAQITLTRSILTAL